MYSNKPFNLKKKCLLLLVATTALVHYAAAQGTITGKLLDSATQKPLYMATITVFEARDTSIITYRLSAEDGEFKVPGLPLNKMCRVLISFSGYRVYRQEFELTDGSQQLNIGTISMIADATSLDEVLVIAERPPMVIRRDTVEFNANAFKTLPNALVEDLLRKLPGVQVDSDGNITVNGKRVNKIMVDGKNFFGSDPKMASRNLPSNVIDKIQVTDDKDELLENGDDNINNVGKVINLTFKKGVKKGLFGKAYAGGGGGVNGSRFEAGAIANMFRDTLQVSLLGYSNNLNRPGFGRTDLMQTGGMQRNRSVSGGGNNSTNMSNFGSSIMIDGINFGGMSRYGGVTTSNGLGFNLNHSPNNEKSFFAQYFYGQVHTDVDQRNKTEIFNGDTVVTNNSLYNADIVGNTHTLGIGLNLKPDTLTTVNATASYIMAREDNDSRNIQTGYNNFLGDLNNGDILIGALTNADILRQNFSLTKLSQNKKGRRLAVTQGFFWNKRSVDTYTDGLIHYIYPQTYDSLTNQLRKEVIPIMNVFVGANYREPLSKKIFLRASTRYDYDKLETDVRTLDKSGSGYDVTNEDLSSMFTRNSHKYIAGTGLEFKQGDLSITPGIRYQYQQFDNRVAYQPNAIVQNLNYVLPMLEIVYKKLNVNFTRDVILPDYNSVTPVQNNSNPYMINFGNVNLTPALINRVYVSLNTFNPKNNLNVWSWGEASTTENDVVQDIVLDESGVQTTRLMNADGSSRIAANFGLNQDIKYKNSFTLSWNFGTWTEYRKNKFFYNKEEGTQKRLWSNVWSGLRLNWNDKLEINPSYSFSYRIVDNDNPLFSSPKTFDQTLGTEVVVRYIKHVIFETEARYLNNNAFADPQYRKIFMWNAGVNFTFFSDERAVLRLYANDLLNQTRSVYMLPNQNTLRTSYNNIIGQHFLATFTYNLRPAGTKKKVGGGWSLW